MKIILIIFITLFITVTVRSRLFNPKSSEALQTAIDSSNPGDTIQLEPMDYVGDFVIEHSGEKSKQLKIYGTIDADGFSTTQILGNTTALFVKGDYWFVKDLNITSGEEGLVVEGNNNHLESIAIFKSLQAVSISGNENTLGSISISNVREGIVVHGNHNVFRDIAWSNANSGILIEKGNNNKLHNLAIHNNIKEGVGLLLESGTCCGRLTNVVVGGLAEIRGNNYYFRQTVAMEAVNVLGCNNTFGRSVFGRSYFTKSCDNNMRSSNVLHYPQTKPTLLKDI